MLNKDYKKMLQRLLENKVDFIIVGAYALAAHGYPRATGDIDIWVKPEKANASRVYKTLSIFGAPMKGVTEGDFKTKGLIFQIGVPPRRIDIVTAIDGVGFDEAEKDKIIVEVENLKLPVLSMEKLILNKESTGREKDRLDAKLLKKRLLKS